MSTLNFKDCVDNFPLIVMSDFEMCRAFWGDEDEEGNKITEYNEFDLQGAYDCLFDNDEFFCNGTQTFNDSLEALNNNLSWYSVSLKSGYYDGVQIYVDTDWINISEWSEEDCNDEFSLSKEETIQMIANEREQILNFMKECEDFGFRELLHLGTFSNGEGIYQYKDSFLKHNS